MNLLKGFILGTCYFFSVAQANNETVHTILENKSKIAVPIECTLKQAINDNTDTVVYKNFILEKAEPIDWHFIPARYLNGPYIACTIKFPKDDDYEFKLNIVNHIKMELRGTDCKKGDYHEGRAPGAKLKVICS